MSYPLDKEFQMPALIKDFETENYIDYPGASWPLEEEKERPYRQEAQSPIIWEISRSVRPTSTESILQKLISDSRRILKCHDDSDEEFIPYSQETLDRAIEFLTPYIKGAETALGVAIPIPKLLPGPSGSVDVHWKNEKKELVVNIPANKNIHASFYGDNYGKLFIKGTLDTTSLHLSVLMWLLNS